MIPVNAVTKSKGKIIASKDSLTRSIQRLCFQLMEHHGDFSGSCIIGIQNKGVWLAERLKEKLYQLDPKLAILSGKLDITFFRDDFRKGNKILTAASTEIDFLIENKRVILVDDVLYTGRTIQAALQALQQFGRPASVELLVLVDRRFNRHLPIQPNYVGIRVDALEEAYVQVKWSEEGDNDKIIMFDSEPKQI